MILQVAFLSCTGMLTVMTSSLDNIKLHAPYLEVSSENWPRRTEGSPYTEVCEDMQKFSTDDITCTPSIGQHAMRSASVES